MDVTESVYVDEAGRSVHVFVDALGKEIKVIEYHPADYIFHDEQWCPTCLRKAVHRKDHWKCSSCGWNITDDEVAETNGIPSMAAALDYRDEHGL